MGSSGSYSAEVYITVPLSQKENNTEEEVSEFLSKNKIKAIVEIKNKDVDENVLRKIFESTDKIYRVDIDDFDYDYAVLYNKYKSSEIECIIEEIEDCEENEFFYLKELTYKDLKNINLDLLSKSKIKYLDSSLEYKEYILSCSESIYYDNDNSSGDSKKVNKKLLELLSIPGAYINLNANGNSY